MTIWTWPGPTERKPKPSKVRFHLATCPNDGPSNGLPSSYAACTAIAVHFLSQRSGRHAKPSWGE
eukprot:3442768-Alexandrium_andersonii.AAC.1